MANANYPIIKCSLLKKNLLKSCCTFTLHRGKPCLHCSKINPDKPWLSLKETLCPVSIYSGRNESSRYHSLSFVRDFQIMLLHRLVVWQLEHCTPTHACYIAHWSLPVKQDFAMYLYTDVQVTVYAPTAVVWAWQVSLSSSKTAFPW